MDAYSSPGAVVPFSWRGARYVAGVAPATLAAPPPESLIIVLIGNCPGLQCSALTRAVLGLLLLSAAPLHAQAPPFEVLHRFFDGNLSSPDSLIRSSDGTLNGTTSGGGLSGCGTVFTVDGAGDITVVHAFAPLDAARPPVRCDHQIIEGPDGNLFGWTREQFATVGPLLSENASGYLFMLTPTGTFSLVRDLRADTYPVAYALVRGGDGAVYGLSRTRTHSSFGTTSIVFRIASGVMAVLHAFDISDGALAQTLTWASDGNLYGTTSGTAFRLTPSGTFTPLHAFVTAEGSNSRALLQGTDGDFYGLMDAGGAHGYGTAYRMTAAGSVTVLRSFEASEGRPLAPFIQANDGRLYGATKSTAAPTSLRLFQMTVGGMWSVASPVLPTPQPSTVTALVPGSDDALYATATSVALPGRGSLTRTTSDGTTTVVSAFPPSAQGLSARSALVEDAAGVLFGVAAAGGVSGRGVLYSLTTAGTVTAVHPFGGGASDGAEPLVLAASADGTVIYGTTNRGGAFDCGTVFRLGVGGALTVLHSFACRAGTPAGSPVGPNTLVVAVDGQIYGTTQAGSALSRGTLFRLAPNGDFATLLDLNAPPRSLTRGRDGAVYGTTGESFLASFNIGSVFRVGPAGDVTTIGGGSSYSALVHAADGYLYAGLPYSNEIVRMSTTGATEAFYRLANDGGRPLEPQSLMEAADGSLIGTATRRPFDEPIGDPGLGVVYRLTLTGDYTLLRADLDVAGPMAEASDGQVYSVCVCGSGSIGSRINAAFRIQPSPLLPPPPLTLTFATRANAPALSTGGTLAVTATLTPAGHQTPVDAYLVMQLPTGEYYSLQLSGAFVPGVLPLARGFVPFDVTAVVLSHRFQGTEPPGPYTFLSALAAPGTVQLLTPIVATTVVFSP